MSRARSQLPRSSPQGVWSRWSKCRIEAANCSCSAARRSCSICSNQVRVAGASFLASAAAWERAKRRGQRAYERRLVGRVLFAKPTCQDAPIEGFAPRRDEVGGHDGEGQGVALFEHQAGMATTESALSHARSPTDVVDALGEQGGDP
ncbi:MAG: hypothetical protein KIS66_01915 [Fimbriimonadaceae bacterium]|nr:hypothetical protein [Fimbriimonadaceae bacterium]